MSHVALARAMFQLLIVRSKLYGVPHVSQWIFATWMISNLIEMRVFHYHEIPWWKYVWNGRHKCDFHFHAAWCMEEKNIINRTFYPPSFLHQRYLCHNANYKSEKFKLCHRCNGLHVQPSETLVSIFHLHCLNKNRIDDWSINRRNDLISNFKIFCFCECFLIEINYCTAI